jgi:hypothetical protein
MLLLLLLLQRSGLLGAAAAAILAVAVAVVMKVFTSCMCTLVVVREAELVAVNLKACIGSYSTSTGTDCT